MSRPRQDIHNWTYENPSEWPKDFPSASGSHQSPININSKEIVIQNYPPFLFSAGYKHQILLHIINNGRQVTAILPESDNQTDLWVRGGGLSGTYCFVNFHLHWGTNNQHGSEHEIDGNVYPAEAHFVHKNRETEQIAVFAFFLNITKSIERANEEWKKYSKTLGQLSAGETIDCTFNLSKMMNINSKQYFRYTGSLTTPPCTEGVIWTVFSDVILISKDDLNLIRKSIMGEIHRPIQSINDRIIYKSDNIYSI